MAFYSNQTFEPNDASEKQYFHQVRLISYLQILLDMFETTILLSIIPLESYLNWEAWLTLGSCRVMSSPQLKTSLIPRLLIYWGRTPASKAKKSLLYFISLSRGPKIHLRVSLAATVSINNCRKIPLKKSAIYLVFIRFSAILWRSRTLFMVDISHG